MKDFISVILRLFLYAFVFLADYFIIFADILERSVKEDSVIEIAQESYLFIIVVILIIQSFKVPKFKNLSYILALFFAMHLVREFDLFLDMVFDGLWQIIAFSMLGLAVFLFVKNRQSIIQQIGTLKNDISTGLFLIGLTLLHVFSRLWGKSDNWKTLLEDNYRRVFKDLAEEGIELVSYSILLIATIQLFLTLKSSISKDGE